jgi:serine/threonine-protein kinase
VVRFSISLPANLRLDPASGLALSPDSGKLVGVAQTASGSQLFSRRLDNPDSVLLPGTEGAASPSFSPDGNSVAYVATGKLKVTPLGGGPTVTLADATAFGTAWLPDGRIVFHSAKDLGLEAVSADGGDPKHLASPPPASRESALLSPDVLPGGNAILSTIMLGMGLESRNIALVPLGNVPPSVLVENGANPVYVPSGQIVFQREQNLLAVAFDARQLRAAGAPVTLMENIGAFAVSRSGTLAFARYSPNGGERGKLVWVDRKGVASELASSRFFTSPSRLWPALSPDGRRIALTSIDGRKPDIWVWELQRDVLTRLTSNTRSHIPLWTPDGNRVVTSTDSPKTGANLTWLPVDGSKPAERLTTSEFHQDPGSWAPDAKSMAFAQISQGRSEIWLLQVEPRREARPLVQSAADTRDPAISPDGRWLAYSSNESGRFEVYVRPFPQGDGRWQISSGGGREPLWARNGHELFYRLDKKVMAVSIPGGTALNPGKVEQLFEGNYATTGGYGKPNYDVSPDGQHFLMVRREAPEAPAPIDIEIVLNWAEELKRLNAPRR